MAVRRQKFAVEASAARGLDAIGHRAPRTGRQYPPLTLVWQRDAARFFAWRQRPVTTAGAVGQADSSAPSAAPSGERTSPPQGSPLGWTVREGMPGDWRRPWR